MFSFQSFLFRRLFDSFQYISVSAEKTYLGLVSNQQASKPKPWFGFTWLWF
jgi:hypothetical protein